MEVIFGSLSEFVMCDLGCSIVYMLLQSNSNMVLQHGLMKNKVKNEPLCLAPVTCDISFLYFASMRGDNSGNSKRNCSE